MSNGWRKKQRVWWFTDFNDAEGASKLSARALPGFWQVAPYETADLAGVAIVANPTAAAPELRIPLPAAGRFSISLGLLENYCDRVLVKIEGDRCFDRLAHGDVSKSENNAIQDTWFKDADMKKGDVLVIKQDEMMARRCGIAYVRLEPAGPATLPQIPLIATADGGPGNNGAISFDEMLGEELLFADTHVAAICHGTDISGLAQYTTKLPSHRYPAEVKHEETFIGADYYPWIVEQMLKYEAADRCLLRDSIGAAHSIARKFYAYHRMGVTRLYAPMRMFENPMYDAHPEWRCIDTDGTPISRLSIAFPEVREYFLDHFRETVEYGADGVCLVFARGCPLILFEEPVAHEYKKRTKRSMKKAKPDDPDLLAIRTEIFNGFVHDIHQTVTKAGHGRSTRILALPLATPAINRAFAMDCRAWAKNGWVQTFCPYPYGMVAKRTDIDVRSWARELKGTHAQLCPILNRGSAHTGLAMLDTAEKWLAQGADGLSMWDWDSHLSIPMYRLLGYHLGSPQGRKHLRAIFSGEWPKRIAMKTFDGIAVDRFHPGWNV